MAFGYSLGEIAALIAGGVFEMRNALRVPLAVAQDCAELAANTTLGVLFCADPRSTWARLSGFASGSTSPGTA